MKRKKSWGDGGERQKPEGKRDREGRRQEGKGSRRKGGRKEDILAHSITEHLVQVFPDYF